MKKGLFLVGLFASVMLLSSCTDDDMELLRHPYHVQGDFGPSFRLPVISRGELNLNQLLQSFDGTFSGNLDVNDTTIVFLYETTFNDSLEVNTVTGSKSMPAAKGGRVPRPVATGNELISIDTTISYTVPIDLFDRADMQDLVQADITIKSILADIQAEIHGTCPNNAEQSVRDYVSARFDNVAIDYVGHDGTNHHYYGLPEISVEVDNLIDGGTLDLTGANQLNLAPIVNSLPSSITFSFKVHVIVDEGFADENTQDLEHIQHFHELLDSLNMTTLYYNADIDLRVPFEVHIGDLTYSYPLSLGENADEESSSVMDQIDSLLNDLLGEGSVSLDSSKVTAYLVLKNGIPLNFSLTGTLTDANDAPLCVLVNDAQIPASETIPTLTPGVSKADPEHPGTAIIEIPLSVGDLEHLANASTLRLDLGMSTNDTDHKRVSPDDYLSISLQIKLDANIVVDMELLSRSPEDIIYGLPVVGSILRRF